MKFTILLPAVLALTPVFAEYGAGEMTTPGKTFYLSLTGDDKNDGATPQTPWRTLEHAVKHLDAGVTLEIAEGVYQTGKGDSLRRQPDYCSIYKDGKPGSPIRIRGAGRGKTVLTGAIHYKNPKRIGADRTMEYKLKYPPLYETVWEHPSQIKLQKVRFPRLVKEYPGTFHFDPATKTLTVHFVANDQTGVNVSYDRIGLAVRGSYVSIEGITFTHYCEAVFAQQNAQITRDVGHLTVKDCGFFNNYYSGVVLRRMTRALITGNQAMNNGEYGSFYINGDCWDNLLIGNWAGPSPETRREQKPYDYGFAIQRYGGEGKGKNRIIGNVMADELAFRWKIAEPDGRFEDNIVKGRLHAECEPYPVVIRRNFFGGRISWRSLGNDLREKDFTGSGIIFENNVRDMKDFKPENKNALEALKLALPQPKITFPWCHFSNIAVKYADKDSAVIEFFTVRNDGWGSVIYRARGEKKWNTVKSRRQGVRHVLALSGLKSDTEYEYQLLFQGRRGEKARGKVLTFRTGKSDRAPMTITVDPGKMSLDEAAQMARPGDTVLLLSGRHYGSFVPVCGGLPDRKITLKGEKGAVIDGMFFYGPLVDLTGLDHWVVDGITFDNPEETARPGLVRMDGSNDIVVRNCRNFREFPYMAGPFIYGRGDRFVIENNIAWGGTYQLQLLGNDHVIRRNTLVNGTFFHIFAANAQNITITDNIFYRPCIGGKSNPAYMLQNIKGKIVSDRNVYFSPFKHHRAGGRIRNSNGKDLIVSENLPHWRKATGFDRESIAADPQFIDVEKGDFRLKPQSPAKGKGADIK